MLTPSKTFAPLSAPPIRKQEMPAATNWKGRRKPRVAPKHPEGFVRRPRGPQPKKPRLYFEDAKPPKGWPKGKRYGKWYIYYNRNEYSTGCDWQQKAEAEAEWKEFCRDVELGREARKAPGQTSFADMIKAWLKFLEENANTNAKRVKLATYRKQSVHWLEFFGRTKMITYRKEHSTKFQTWWVNKRAAFYLANPEHRGSAANGANTLLRALKRFVQEWAEQLETGWYPDIFIPDGEDIGPGPFFTRSEQAAMLLVCRGWVKDRKSGKWKFTTYIDENGKERKNYRIRSKGFIRKLKGKSRFIRLGVRTGAREQDLETVVWGAAKHTACLVVDDDGAGTFHRRGSEEPDTNKSRPSSLVPNRLKCLLRIWRKEDGQSKRVTELDRLNSTERRKHRYLIRQYNGKPYTRLSLRQIVRDAGLSPRYTEHALRRTAVEEAHLQCWSLATATHMIGMTAVVLMKFYTDWNERARRSEAQALREANSTANARALRSVPDTPREDGDRVRHNDRKAARLKAEWEKANAHAGQVPAPTAQDGVLGEDAEGLAALRAANDLTSAHRLRKADLKEPEPANDRGNAPDAMAAAS